MFRPVELITSDIRIQKAWRGLQRIVQTVIEHLRVVNYSGGALARGDVLSFTVDGARTVELAQSGGLATFPHIAVACEPIPALGSGIARYQGYAFCRFEDGLDPRCGHKAYLSDTVPGALTTADTGDFVGIIANGTGYVTVTNHFAYVIINRCCEGAVVIE